MSLPDILLSLLRQPMSGTDLSRLFQGTINHFWNTDLSQIYKALDGLEREGCLRSESLPSRRGPARKVYALTSPGRERLAAWLLKEPRVPAAKFEYLAQLFSATADERPRERAQEILRSMRDEAAQALATLEAIDAQFATAPGYPEALPSFVFYPWLTLRHGLRRRRAFVEWVDECLQLLDRRPDEAEEGGGPDAMSALVEALQLVAESGEDGRSAGRRDDGELVANDKETV